VIVDVEFHERYWYPDDGGQVWVAGYQLVDAEGRFAGRDAVPGTIVTWVAGAVHRPDALASELAAPGCALAVAVDLRDGTPLGYVPREFAPRVDASWSALVLRERRRTPRDPRDGLTMLLAAEPIELRVR
jgi:hypothetical protein